MIGMYTGLIKRKLGLEKRIDSHEMYIYKYHTNLQPEKARFRVKPGGNTDLQTKTV